MEFKELTYQTAIRGAFCDYKWEQFQRWKEYLDNRVSNYPIEDFHDEINKIVDIVKKDSYIVVKDFFDKSDLQKFLSKVKSVKGLEVVSNEKQPGGHFVVRVKSDNKKVIDKSNSIALQAMS